MTTNRFQEDGEGIVWEQEPESKESITKKASKNRFILTDEDAPGIEVLYTPPATDHEQPDTQGTITLHTEEN